MEIYFLFIFSFICSCVPCSREFSLVEIFVRKQETCYEILDFGGMGLKSLEHAYAHGMIRRCAYSVTWCWLIRSFGGSWTHNLG